jgi:DNA mismatch endonuclease, patch repair protein
MEKCLKDILGSYQFSNVSAQRSRAMGAVRSRGNRTTEQRLRMTLIRARVSGWKLHKDLPGRPDFYFASAKLALFVDGCFWHGCEICGHTPKSRREFWKAKIQRNRERDIRVVAELRHLGITAYRIWEHELATTATRRSLLRRIERIICRKARRLN